MRLMLAEDDPILADALLTQLGHAGFDVVHAPNGAVAEYLLLREDFDVALLDIGLPMVDGLTVLRRVRQQKPALPVVVLTVLDGLRYRVDGLNAGADDYMTKPVAFPELEARLRALLRRVSVAGGAAGGTAGGTAGVVAAAEPSAAEMGRLVFDRAARRASVDGKVIDMPPREWDLLDLLLTQRDRVVQKERITQVWAADGQRGEVPAAPGMVEVYIHRLRRKLEGSGLSIRTVRGLGYLLELEQR